MTASLFDVVRCDFALFEKEKTRKRQLGSCWVRVGDAMVGTYMRGGWNVASVGNSTRQEVWRHGGRFWRGLG